MRAFRHGCCTILHQLSLDSGVSHAVGWSLLRGPRDCAKRNSCHSLERRLDNDLCPSFGQAGCRWYLGRSFKCGIWAPLLKEVASWNHDAGSRWKGLLESDWKPTPLHTTLASMLSLQSSWTSLWQIVRHDSQRMTEHDKLLCKGLRCGCNLGFVSACPSRP